MADQGSSKPARKLRAWVYLAVSVGMAILSLDTLISGLWGWAVGTPGYLQKIPLGLLGLLLGLYLILRFVYRYDLRQGRIKKEIPFLGGKVTNNKPVTVTIFSKEDCCLCDKAKEIVDKVARDYPLQVEVFDITTDAEIFEKYRYVIPVVAINGEEKFVSKVSELWLRRALDEMQYKPEM